MQGDPDKQVLLCTGGCGYIFGSFLNIMVRKYPNWKFINLDALYPASLPENIERHVKESPNYTFVHGKLQDAALLARVLAEHRPTIIVHAAAKSNVDESYMEPLSYIDDNVVGTATFLHAVKESGLDPLFVHVSTDEVYSHSIGDTKNSELSLLRPSNPYSSSKAAGEMCAMAYYQSYHLRLIIVRPNNVYGVNHKHKMIPKFIDQLLEGQKITIHGDGSARRSFLYITDMISAFETIILHGAVGEIYNIASQCEISVLEMSKRLVEKIKNTENWLEHVLFVPDRPFNDMRYLISDEKLKALGFRQKVTIDEGLNAILSRHGEKTDRSQPSQ